MTLRTFFPNSHPLNSFFKLTLKKQTPITLLVTAFTLLITPGILISEIGDSTVFNRYVIGNDEFIAFAGIILVASALLSFMLLLQNFGFIYSKKAGDMYNALPLTRNQMLFSRFSSSFIGAFFTMNVAFILLTLVNFLPSVEGVELLFVLKCYLFMSLILLVITAFLLLFVICSGGYFDAIIATGAINLGPVAVLAILFLMADESTSGLQMDYQYLIYVNPIAFMVYKFVCLYLYESKSFVPTQFDNISVFTILGIVIFGVLCVIAAVKLFKVRKSETAGDAYSFRFMPIIISALISMVGGFVIGGILTGFNTNFNILFWLFFIIGAILCAIAFGAIANRGFKKVKASLINGAVSALIMVALVCTTNTMAMAAETRVPNAKDVKMVYFGYNEDVVFEKDIKEITELHKAVIECLQAENDGVFEEYPGIVHNLRGIVFKYVMKNGAVINRYYSYDMPDMTPLNSKLLKVMQRDDFLSRFDSCTEVNEYGIININSHSKFGEDISEEFVGANAIISKAEAKRLIELFKQDMKNSSADVVFSGDVYGLSVSGRDYHDIYIHKSFTNTVEYVLELFEKHNDGDANDETLVD